MQGFRLIGIGLLIVAGGIIGAVGSTCLDNRTEASKSAPSGRSAAAPPAATPPAANAAADDLRTRVAMGRMSALERQVSALAGHGGVAAEDSDEQANERRTQAAAFHTELLAMAERHRAEPTDPSWSGTAEASLAQEVQALIDAEGVSAELGSVDCRADSCAVVLSFPSYGDAARHYGGFVTVPYTVHCTAWSSIEPPGDPSLPYEVMMLLTDCER